jgi:hypothetical protein
MKHTLLLSLVAVAGCVGPGDELDLEAPGEPATSTTTQHIVGESEQGRHILGSFADTLLASGTHFRVSVNAAVPAGFRLSVNAAGVGGANGTHLIADDGAAPAADHVGADPWFIGMIMSGPGGELRVRDVGVIGTTVLSTVYFLDYRQVTPGNIGPWVDYCDGAGGAIALAGSYDVRRIHQPGAWISFGCANGVAQKCNGWGYPAGVGGPGDPAWDHHQACTAMANADYCRSGTSYTRELTPILIRDYAPEFVMPPPTDIGHPTPYPGDPDTHYFEAGWRPRDLAPVCLSKLRWASLPPNPCPLVLPDPRYSEDARAKFCDDMTISEIRSLGALVVNGSKMMDAPLGRWRNPVTGDVVQTIRGFFIDRDSVTGPDPTSTIPYPGYTEYLGVDSMILRNLPGTLVPADMYTLYMQESPTTHDRAVAHDLIPGHVMGAFEGYAFKDPTKVPGLTGLSLCNKTGDFRTTIGTPLGCAFAAPLKFALPPP